MYLLQVPAADLTGKGKGPCPELSTDKNERERADITESLVPTNTA